MLYLWMFMTSMSLLSFDLCFLWIFNCYFEKKISNLAHVFFLIVDPLDDSWIRCSKLSELFIRSNVCYFLELLNCISLFNVQFFDCAFFNLLAEVRKMELNHSECAFQDAYAWKLQKLRA